MIDLYLQLHILQLNAPLVTSNLNSAYKIISDIPEQYINTNLTHQPTQLNLIAISLPLIH